MIKKLKMILLSVILILPFTGCSNYKSLINEIENNTQATEELFNSSKGFFSYERPAMIQLTNINNENIPEEYSKPFKVNKFDSGSSGITRFILEDGTIRTVHCDFIVLASKYYY